MSAGEQVFEVHRFQTYPQWIGSLRSSASALAGAIGARLMDWEEDGLGPAHGFLWRLPSDRIVLIEELEHLSSAGQPRIDLQVDLTEVAESGADAILAEATAIVLVMPFSFSANKLWSFRS